jgi:hypothetical protein
VSVESSGYPTSSIVSLATLLVVLDVLPIEDAANAVGLTPDDLVAEAEAWAVASETQNGD